MAYKSKQFIPIGELRIVNVKHIHTVTLNKDKQWGWVKIVDEGDKFSKYKISPEEFVSISKVLLEVENGDDVNG